MTNTWEERAKALELRAAQRDAERKAEQAHRTRISTPPANAPEDNPGLLTFDEAMKTLPRNEVDDLREVPVVTIKGDSIPVRQVTRAIPGSPFIRIPVPTFTSTHPIYDQLSAKHGIKIGISW